MRRAHAVQWGLTTLLGVVVVGSGVVAGHVRYVTDANQVGDGLEFLATALADPVNAAAIGGGALATLLVVAAYLRVRPLRRDVAEFRAAMADYEDLLPWLLRLGFGLPLVGAGFAGYLFNPVVDPFVDGGLVRLFQIGLGFALLFGLATRAAALVGLLAYLLSLAVEPLLLYSLEWIPGFLALALVGSGRPSADETLQRIAAAEGTFYGRVDPVHAAAARLNEAVEPYARLVPTIVRVGMGVAFAFLGVFEKLLAPAMATEVVEQYRLAEVVPVPPELWVLGAGFAELGLGVAIAVGAFTRASALTAMAVFTLTLFAIPDDPVLAHIGLFSLASALLVTGSGPFALDRRLGASGSDDRGPGGEVPVDA